MFKNMKLGIKQGLGFGIMIFFAFILGIEGWSGLDNVEKAVNIADDQNRLIKYALEIRRHEKNYQLHRDVQSSENVLALLVKIETQIENTKGNLEKEKGLPVMVADYKKAFEAFSALSDHQQLDEEIMRDAAKKFIKASEELRQEAKVSLRYSISKSENMMITVTIACVMAGALIAFFITRAVTVPIKKGVLFAQKMSKGDFQQRLDIDQKDEIGVLAEALNSVAANVGDMVKEIDSGVNTLSSSSTEMADISDQMTSGSENTVVKANSVAAAAEEMNTNMNSVAAAMEQASTNIGAVAAAAEEMSANIGNLSNNARDAKETTDNVVGFTKKVSNQVNELGQAAEEISVVTESIKSISDKTNLLALNATIEAARAGEAGKGFAVVANEIKDLARQTAEATGDISQKIDGIQNATGATVSEINDVVDAINKVDELIKSIAEAVEQQNTATAEISENVNHASLGLTEINENVNQSSEAAGMVAKEITEVNESANEISNSSAQVQQSANDLSKLSGRLQELIHKFKI
ncbi:MAG: hypothetical protein BA867_13005 [Desulfobacterales bacterium S5133MH16]|nr:MAG: hypothetical protein BA867_13005 [Desulfobacterales bacterium S5133MH16]